MQVDWEHYDFEDLLLKASDYHKGLQIGYFMVIWDLIKCAGENAQLGSWIIEEVSQEGVSISFTKEIYCGGYHTDTECDERFYPWEILLAGSGPINRFNADLDKKAEDAEKAYKEESRKRYELARENDERREFLRLAAKYAPIVEG